MRITIGIRIFLALTLVSVAILALNAVVTRWNFERGFLDYVSQQETDTLRDAASELASLYTAENGWEMFRDNPRRWNDFLRSNSDQPPPRRRPGPGERPGGPPPPEPVDFGRRIALLNAGGDLLIGPPDIKDARQSVPIVVDGVSVGFLVIAPRRELTSDIDRNFARQQERSIYITAAVALLFAAIISAILARQLTRPVRALASGARSIAAGDFDTRIEAARDDELGDLANEINQLAATLKKSQLSRKQWVADIAHELRTPLAVLRGELDAIEDGVRSFDAAKRESLQAEVARLTKLVGDLHDLSVYDEGGLSYQNERLDISGFLAALLDRAEPRLRDAGIALTRRLPDIPVVVLADETRLEQLFANLIENTIRYTDAPGSLFITCRVESDNIDIDFADSAPGVPESALDRLFDRLFRVEASRSRHSGGAGLGLSICKAIVDACGGSIQALGSEAGGLLIRITLPLADSSSNPT